MHLRVEARRAFEWDEVKAASNLTKHGVAFNDAVGTFDDLRRVDFDVSRAADGEERRKVLGIIKDRVFAVVYVLRGGVIRLISARPANRTEERRYGDH